MKKHARKEAVKQTLAHANVCGSWSMGWWMVDPAVRRVGARTRIEFFFFFSCSFLPPSSGSWLGSYEFNSSMYIYIQSIYSRIHRERNNESLKKNLCMADIVLCMADHCFILDTIRTPRQPASSSQSATAIPESYSWAQPTVLVDFVSGYDIYSIQ